MKFFAIRNDSSAELAGRVKLMRDACQRHGVELVDLNAEVLDYSALPEVQVGDLVYNLGRGAQVLETMMLSSRVATFYSDGRLLNMNLMNTTTVWAIIHEKAGLPAPKTIHRITADRDLLASYIAILGGFPIVIKAAGGSHGLGAIKVDSVSSLYSIADWLMSIGSHYIMRQFIPNAISGRIVVLGSECIASIRYTNPPGDFRSNGLPEVAAEAATYSSEIRRDAVEAVRCLGYEVGAVDLVVDQSGRHYLLEMNSPFGLDITTRATGVDVSGLMVRYLIEKSNRLFAAV